MEAVTKNKRGRPKRKDADFINSLALSINTEYRTAQNQLFAVKAIKTIIEPYYPEDVGLFKKVTKYNIKILRQGVAEQIGRVIEESGEETAIRYAGECIELIKQGARSKDVEKAVRIVRKEIKKDDYRET